MKLANWISVSGAALAAVILGLGTAQNAWCIDVEVAEAPANDLQLTISAINSAQKSLLLNIYELSSPDIADALLSRIQAGVSVQIIEEAQPVGGMSTASKGIVSQLAQAMQSSGSDDHLYEMTSKAGGKRRFHYDHAKYVVIDGSSVLVGSENYSPTGNPQPGTVGNRGWEVLIHDASLANEFAQVFQSDSNGQGRDILDVTQPGVAQALFCDDARKKPVPTHPAPQNPAPQNPAPSVPASQLPMYSADQIQKITSPDTSLSGLTAMIRSATTSIDVEQMTLDPKWGTNGPQSKLLAELLAAARRGVRVRVLLNDETVFDHPSHPSKPKNRVTIQLLNDAANQGLPVEALVANLKAMGVDYIHNKGAVVDGNKTLISSINWDENAVEKNREAAVLITSTDIYNHYESLFEQDWEASGGSAIPQRLTAQSERFSVPVGIDAVNCPQSIQLGVDIGQVTLDQSDDQSFKALSGQHFELNMTRDKQTRGCIFMTTGRTMSKKVLEIRKDSHGDTVFSLEGYTARGKLYSIRAKTDAEVDDGAQLPATLYDGSGPAREKLADAELTVDVQ